VDRANGRPQRLHLLSVRAVTNMMSFNCASCGRQIRMYRMHFIVSEGHVICGTCIHDSKTPVLAACQTRKSAYAHLRQAGRSRAK